MYIYNIYIDRANGALVGLLHVTSQHYNDDPLFVFTMCVLEPRG